MWAPHIHPHGTTCFLYLGSGWAVAALRSRSVLLGTGPDHHCDTQQCILFPCRVRVLDPRCGCEADTEQVSGNLPWVSTFLFVKCRSHQFCPFHRQLDKSGKRFWSHKQLHEGMPARRSHTNSSRTRDWARYILGKWSCHWERTREQVHVLPKKKHNSALPQNVGLAWTCLGSGLWI